MELLVKPSAKQLNFKDPNWGWRGCHYKLPKDMQVVFMDGLHLTNVAFHMEICFMVGNGSYHLGPHANVTWCNCADDQDGE